MVKALADRLAEAFAERCTSACAGILGLCAGRGAAPAELIARNIAASARRPAIRRSPTTPRRRRCSRCSTASAIGVTLTESFAMWPGASVCGLYFSHPESHYFGVGKIERDQVEDYAQAQGLDVAEARRWLAPVLNYDPLAARARRRSRAPRLIKTLQKTNTGEVPSPVSV
jgi:5-methyltetrahydrofolate--homocysteine methyltransferase